MRKLRQQEPADRSDPCAAVGRSSLREVEATLASQQARLYHLGATAPDAPRSPMPTRTGPPMCSVSLFETLLAQAHPGLRRASREAVRLVDATSAASTRMRRAGR